MDIADLAEELRGTPKGLYEVLETHDRDELTPEEAAELDQLVFCCEECGWWCEISEMSEVCDEGELVCSDCRPNEEDD